MYINNTLFNLNLSSYFASRVKAIVAETRGVEALVPVNPSVHPSLRSIVVCYINKKYIIILAMKIIITTFESNFLCKKSGMSLKQVKLTQNTFSLLLIACINFSDLLTNVTNNH